MRRVSGSGVGVAVERDVSYGARWGPAVEDPCSHYPAVGAGEQDAGGEECERPGGTHVHGRGWALSCSTEVGLTQVYCCLGKVTLRLLEPEGLDEAALALWLCLCRGRSPPRLCPLSLCLCLYHHLSVVGSRQRRPRGWRGQRQAEGGGCMRPE